MLNAPAFSESQSMSETDIAAFKPQGYEPKSDFVRVMQELPKLASMKIDKQRLRREAWRVGSVFWRPGRDDGLRGVEETDRRRLDPLLRRICPKQNT